MISSAEMTEVEDVNRCSVLSVESIRYFNTLSVSRVNNNERVKESEESLEFELVVITLARKKR